MRAGSGAIEGAEAGFVVVGGARVRYLRTGQGRPLLLLHGIVGAGAVWAGNLPSFEQQATVYALDLPGMGRSDRVAGMAADLESTARRVLTVMDELGLPAADVAGASHGGAVAMMMAALAPERVLSLVLFAPVNPYSSKADWMVRLYSSALGEPVARMAARMPRRVQQIALARMFGSRSRIPAGALEPYRAALLVPGTVPHVLAMVRTWFADMAKLRGLLPRLRGRPTLLVWGDKDRAVSVDSGRRLEQELGAELVVLHGGGHLVFTEFADEVNGIVVDWLQRLPGR